MKKALFGAALVIVLAAGWATFHWRSEKKAPEPPKLADRATLRILAQGQLVGFDDSKDTYAWIGIPYAAPPVGELRWKAPRPAQAWQGLREALKFGSFCPQYGGGATEVPKELYGQFVGTEDCLYLNVWTPRLSPDTLAEAAKHLPVMVWIHGGANTAGSGSMYAQIRNLAHAQNIVAVTFNYRLGPLGWFHHPAVIHEGDSAEDRSGNYGTLDTIAALQWVKDNIAAFGGDPQNVTVFGESAGGMNVFALLASPRAKGLFAKAIAQSGVAQTHPMSRAVNFTDDAQPGAPNSAREVVNKLLIADGLADSRSSAVQRQTAMSAAEMETYLRGKSAQQLLAPFAIQAKREFGFYHMPTVMRDGAVIPDRPLPQLLADPSQYNAVPVIVGSNRDEMKLFMANDPELVTKWFGKIPRIKDPVRYERETAYFSDQWKGHSVDAPAAAMRAAQGPSVYGYRFDWSEEPTNFLVDLKTLIGASHGAEIFMLFGDYQDELSGFSAMYTKENYAGRKEISDAMASYWTQFAYTGAPGRGREGRLPEWKAWDNGAAVDKFIILDTTHGGGIRMSSATVSDGAIKQRLLADQSAIGSQQQLCALYARLFRYTFNADYEAWKEDEYRNFGAQGCASYPAALFERAE